MTEVLARLEIWRRALAGHLADRSADLTSRQMVILLTVYLQDPPHTVRGLAAQLGFPKPAIVRALDRLQALDLIRRKADPADKRSVLIQRTVPGAVFLADFAQRIGAG